MIALRDGESFTVSSPSHTREVFEDLKGLVDRLSVKVLELQVKLGFTYIAGSGHSGGLVVSAVSFNTGIPMWVIRRTRNETNNDSRQANGGMVVDSNGYAPKDRSGYLIIDDLIDAGGTVHRIETALEECMPAYGDVRAYGILLYESDYADLFEDRIPVFSCRKKE